MKLRYLIAVVATALMATGIISCNGNKGGETQQSNAPVADTTSQVIDNKDEVTFLTTFLGNYIKLEGKQAQELARKHLTQEFYSAYLESCNNQDNAIDLICEVTLEEKVQRVDTIMKGIEAPESYIVQMEVKGADGMMFTTQYDMSVVKGDDGTFKLSDSQVND